MEDIQTEGSEGMLSLKIGGTINRMNSKEGTFRIVDYKAGGSPKVLANVEQLFTPAEGRPNYIFRTFLYTAIMAHQQILKVTPSLLYIYRVVSESYPPVIEMGEAREPELPVGDFSVHEKELHERLLALLKEIYNDQEEFIQTEDLKKREYCNLKAICERQKAPAGMITRTNQTK